MRDVRPLTPRSPPTPPQKPLRERLAPRLVPATSTSSQPIELGRFAGIDRANAERLKRGQQRIEARLDLHGLSQEEAHRALLGFIRAGRAAGKRCVLVITGRGRLGGGVLKEAVPRWLDEAEFRPHLLAISAAQPRDGGAGAIYVMLRRNTSNPDRR
jgi:DNA-nicking Smr family endonuclease